MLIRILLLTGLAATGWFVFLRRNKLPFHIVTIFALLSAGVTSAQTPNPRLGKWMRDQTMKKLFSLFLLAATGVMVVGLCLDWFSISTTEDSRITKAEPRGHCQPPRRAAGAAHRGGGRQAPSWLPWQRPRGPPSPIRPPRGGNP